MSKTLLEGKLAFVPSMTPQSRKERQIFSPAQLLLAESAVVYATQKWNEPFFFSGRSSTPNSLQQDYHVEAQLRRHTTISFRSDASGRYLESFYDKLGAPTVRNVRIQNGELVISRGDMYVPEVRCNGAHEKNWERRYHAELIEFNRKNVRANQ